jgi:hypothetical protein
MFLMMNALGLGIGYLLSDTVLIWATLGVDIVFLMLVPFLARG